MRDGGQARQLAWGTTVVVYPAMVLTAAAGWSTAFGLLALASYGVELILTTRARGVYHALAIGGFGWTLRGLTRDLAAIVAVATMTQRFVDTVVMAVSMLLIEGARAEKHLLAAVIKKVRTLHAPTRNIDLRDLRIPDQATGFADRLDPRQISSLGVAPIFGILVSAMSDTRAPALVGAGIGGVLALGLMALIARGGLAARRMPKPGRQLAFIRKWINQYAPDVVFYLSGASTSAYQINMWLEVAERLDHRVLVLLRERTVLAGLAQTSLPVVCMPSSTELLGTDIPSVGSVLYVANAGKNIQMLRLPGVRHIFIGHGDSDKVASINPFCKVYDEVWVAGPAGRERFARAAVGVDDARIVEVGRPQLAPIKRGPRPRSGPMTVLYAPTWEGWIDEPQATSLIGMGEKIVSMLLAHPAGVRVIYKPHPLTGTRSKDAAAANDRIIALIGAAAPTSALGELTSALAATAGDPRADETTTARNSGHRDAGATQRTVELSRQWSEAFWASSPESTHRYVDGALPTLFDCFNRTDVLITDISSVVADYLYGGRPYVVTNSIGLDHDAFRDAYPTAAAAELLDTDCRALPGIISDLADGVDRMAEQRIKLTAYLLGDDDESPMDRFVSALAEPLVPVGRRD